MEASWWWFPSSLICSRFSFERMVGNVEVLIESVMVGVEFGRILVSELSSRALSRVS